MIKPRWKTAGFWLTTFAIAVGVVLGSDAFTTQPAFVRVLEFVGAALAAMGYQFTFSYAKKEIATAQAPLRKAPSRGKR